MFIRVVRFTDVDADHVKGLVEEMDAEPPEGVDATRIQIVHDADQGTALALMFFETAEAMKAADAIMGAMDPSETPGTRASVDHGEVLGEMSAA